MKFLTKKSTTQKLTESLIKIPSVTSNKSELDKAILFVENLLPKNCYIKKFKSNGFPSLVAGLKKTKKFDLILYSHLDVVAASSKNQFKPETKKGWLYGRGSGDMKSAAAVIIEVFNHFALQDETKNIGLMLTTDEEIGGQNGAKFLLESKKYTAKLAYVPDSAKGTDTIITNQKGVIHIKIWQNGISAHASRPHLGENAIEKLFSILEKIKKKYDQRHHEWSTTVNIGSICGGELTNQVPDYAEAKIDIRFTKYSQSKQILNYIKKLADDKYELEVEALPFNISSKNQYLKNYLKLLPKTAKLENETGGSDARFFSANEIPAIVTGINKKNSHSCEEACEIKDMLRMKKILIEFIENNF